MEQKHEEQEEERAFHEIDFLLVSSDEKYVTKFQRLSEDIKDAAIWTILYEKGKQDDESINTMLHIYENGIENWYPHSSEKSPTFQIDKENETIEFDDGLYFALIGNEMLMLTCSDCNDVWRVKMRIHSSRVPLNKHKKLFHHFFLQHNTETTKTQQIMTSVAMWINEIENEPFAKTREMFSRNATHKIDNNEIIFGIINANTAHWQPISPREQTREEKQQHAIVFLVPFLYVERTECNSLIKCALHARIQFYQGISKQGHEFIECHCEFTSPGNMKNKFGTTNEFCIIFCPSQEQLVVNYRPVELLFRANSYSANNAAENPFTFIIQRALQQFNIIMYN